MVESLWFIYGTVAFFIVVRGLAVYDQTKKKGARMLLSAPVWPAVLAFILTRGVGRFIRDLWWDADLF